MTGGLRASDVARKSPAGRKPWDEVVIFKALERDHFKMKRSLH
jgi:hypothetical protein